MKFYYFNSTHWDREWYQSFQEFRKYLVDTTELLLNILETEADFQKFIFDGQTIVLKDIVELRPSLRKKLEQFITAGKIKVGPWYVMPDEFLVSPESLIRNLLAGRRLAREFGAEPWPVCYICDIFGHIAQMPQIAAGFGQKGVVVWRGFDADSGPEMLWQGMDGTTLPVVRLLPRNGYGNFTLTVRGWWDLELDEPTFKQRFKSWVDETRNHFGDTFILSDALDHCQASHQVPQILQWIRECYPDAEVIAHSDYIDFFENEFHTPEQLPLAVGEQIIPAVRKDNGGQQISATLSSRYDVKYTNDHCQNRLELQLEPEAAIRSAYGMLKSVESLHFLWAHLIENHAHDSICGCSIDAVHRQVLCRLEEVQQLGNCLAEEFRLWDRERVTGHDCRQDTHTLEQDEELLNLEESAKDGVYHLRLFRALPGDVKEVCVLTLAFPVSTPYPARQAEPFGYEQLNSFKLYGEDGKELPYSLIRVERNRQRRFYRHDCRTYDLYTIAFQPLLRGCGWSSVELRPSAKPVRYRQTQLCGRSSAANQLIRLDIANDGTFTITDLRSGRSYNRQNEYRLDREIGDGWNHVSPSDTGVTIGSSRATIRLLHDGPVYTEFEIIRDYEFPRELLFCGTITEKYAGIRESSETVIQSLHTFVRLEAQSNMLKIRTELKNQAGDFRLRLAVPTGMTGNYFISQSGAFLNRKPGREHGCLSDDFMESERIGKNFDGILGKRDKQGGIALLTRAGIHEAGGIAGDEGELFVTLMRAFRRTVHTDAETEGQLNKHLVWEYAVKYFEPQTTEADLYRSLQNFRMTLNYHQLPASKLKHVPTDRSFLTIDGSLVFSCLKPADDGQPQTVVLRLLNLSADPQQSTIHFAKKFKRASLCRLDETEQQTLAADATFLKVSANPWKWISIKLFF